MGVVLTYTKHDGSPEQVKFRGMYVKKIVLFRKGIKSIDLTPLSSCRSLRQLSLSSNQLQTIDLTPLSSCTYLEFLGLECNQLQTIDLTPLKSSTKLYRLWLDGNWLRTINLAPFSSCVSLQLLNLIKNRLQTIDLTPLSSCTSLQDLWLAQNQLQTIDLSPLRSCNNLGYLYLDDNQLQTIDLIPLSSCTSLQDLSLSGNQLRDIDLTSLSSLVSLRRFLLKDNQGFSWLRLTSGESRIRYERPCRVYPWPFLSQMVLREEGDIRVQQDILCALGLGEYGFIDTDLKSFLASLPPDKALPVIRDRFREYVVEEIADAIDRGGTTTGLHVQNLLTQHGEIAARTHRILELRKEEIENVRVGVGHREADLRELYLTAYGYQVLSSLGKKLTIDVNELAEVRHAFGTLGFKLRTGDTSSPGVKMSRELRNAIWWIIENKGKPWDEIRGS